MISQELEVSLHMAFVEARQKRHEFITVEHLLLALLDNPTALEVLRACAVNIDELRKSLAGFVTEHTPTVAGTEEIDTQPTLGFQRVIQRAILHVQSSGKKDVTGANVLVAIFGEKDSHAVYYLHQQGTTRLDVVNFISHGITKSPQGAAQKGDAEPHGDEQEGQPGGGALEAYTLNLNAQALVGKIDPLIGRDRELERVIQTLCRRRKNNPLLVGEAGVGKTAIAEGLARRIVEGDVPDILRECQVFAQDWAQLGFASADHWPKQVRHHRPEEKPHNAISTRASRTQGQVDEQPNAERLRTMLNPKANRRATVVPASRQNCRLFKMSRRPDRARALPG